MWASCPRQDIVYPLTLLVEAGLLFGVRQGAEEGLVQHHSEGVAITAGWWYVHAGRLWWEIRQRASRLSRSIGCNRESEVHQNGRLIRLTQNDVGRLEI